MNEEYNAYYENKEQDSMQEYGGGCKRRGRK